MTKRLSYILYTMLVPLLLVGCADEPEVQPEGDVEFCVRAAWQNGLASGKTTRALIATDILAAGNGDINIEYADYPASIEVTCNQDGNNFTLTKGSGICSSHPSYWTYTPSYLYSQKYVIRHQLSFHATAQIDDLIDATHTDELEGDFDYSNIDGNHMLLVLRHIRSLLRFTFAVSEKYDKVRYILITGVRFNGVEYNVKPKVLKVYDSHSIECFSPVAYCYVNTNKPLSENNTIECTYSIYDKDANFVIEDNVVTEESITANEPHLTRKDVTARNTFTLSNLKDAGGNPIDKLKAGYYYDIHATINPDYLYVLSEHDNKHMTIK